MKPSPFRAGYQQAVRDAMGQAEFARLVNMAERTVRLRAQDGTLPTARLVGKQYVYYPPDAEALRARHDGRRTRPSIVPSDLSFADPDADWFAPVAIDTPPTIAIPRMTGPEIAAARRAYGLDVHGLLAAIEEATGEEIDGGIDTIIAWETGASEPAVEQTWAIQHLHDLGQTRIADRLEALIAGLSAITPDVHDDPAAFRMAMGVINRLIDLRPAVRAAIEYGR